MDNIEFNYSKVNGSMNKKFNNDSISIKQYNIKSCYKCDANVEDKYLYCKNCGASFEEVYEKNNRNKILSEKSFKSLLSFLDLKNSMRVSLIAISILFVISAICKVGINLTNLEGSRFINIIHILLGINLGSIDIYSSSMMGMEMGGIELGLIVLSIIPFISILIGNVVVNKKHIKSSKYLIRKSFGVAVCYGLLLGIIALFSKTYLDYSYNMMSFGYMIQFKFSVISMIFRGFVLGFVSTYICLYKNCIEDENMYINIFKKAINMVIVGYLFTLIILIIINLSDKSYLYSLGMSTYIDKVGNLVSISQLALYMFGFGNLIPFTIGEKEFSIFNIFTSNIGITTVLLLIAMVFLITLIIFIFSCKLEAKYDRNEGIRPVILLSAFYSIIISIISIISSVYFGGNANMSMGLNLIGTILVSFIYSFIISLAGYKLNIFKD